MRPLCDIPQMCTALISLTQHGVLGLVCAAGILICSWKGRRCQRAGRQEEIKQEFLLSIFTPVRIVPFKYILIYCHPWKMLNVIPTFCRWRVQRGTRMEAATNSCPWNLPWNIMTGWGGGKWEMPNKLTEMKQCGAFITCCITSCSFAGRCASKIK